MGTHHILPGLGREVNLFVCLFSCEDQTICFPKKCFTSVWHHKLEWCDKKEFSEILSFYRLFGTTYLKNSHAKTRSILQLRYGLLKFIFLHTKLSYLVLIDAIKNKRCIREVSMGQCEIYDFSIFTFNSVCDLEFYTGYLDNSVDSNCKFKKWWRHWHIFYYFIPLRVGAGQTIDLELAMLDHEPGELERTLHCRLAHSAAPVYLHIKATFEASHVNVRANVFIHLEN